MQSNANYNFGPAAVHGMQVDQRCLVWPYTLTKMAINIRNITKKIKEI